MDTEGYPIAAADPDISPEDFLLSVMRDPGAPVELRLQAARIAAPLVHPKPNSVDAAAASADPVPANCVDVVTAKALRDDIFRRRSAVRGRSSDVDGDRARAPLRGVPVPGHRAHRKISAA